MILLNYLLQKNKLNLKYRYLLNIKCTKLIRIKILYRGIACVYVKIHQETM